MDDNDIYKIIQGIDSSLDSKLDKKFKEFKETINLELEIKGKVWAKKTIEETLEAVGFDINRPLELQKDMAFVRWLRRLFTNSFTKVFVTVSGVWLVGTAIEWLRSRGYTVSK